MMKFYLWRSNRSLAFGFKREHDKLLLLNVFARDDAIRLFGEDLFEDGMDGTFEKPLCVQAKPAVAVFDESGVVT